MTIKITPRFWSIEEPERRDFEKLILQIQMMGWSRLLLHYDDGSVLLKKMDEEQLRILEELKKPGGVFAKTPSETT